jgi:hypothetical protein
MEHPAPSFGRSGVINIPGLNFLGEELSRQMLLDKLLFFNLQAKEFNTPKHCSYIEPA